MNSSDESNSSKPSRGYSGPKFEDSDAYKAVSLHVEENIKIGQKKELKRQKRMDAIRDLDKPEPEEQPKDSDFF